MANKPPSHFGRRGCCNAAWWWQHREASLNWLALGLLLAAWNAADNDAAHPGRGRPQALRAYPYVSVRAAAMHAATLPNGSRIR